MLGVSDMTVRRDIDILAGAGLIQKVHGGAKVPGSLRTDEPGFEKKSVREEAEKSAIAREALSFVTPGSAIGLSAGTTTWALAKLLRPIEGLTIVTNSIQVADVFYRTAARKDGSRTSVILTGGLRTPSAALVGAVADRAIESLHVDRLFLGVHGMDAAAGLTTPNLAEAHTNAAFISRARQVVVLADSSKWSTIGLATIAPLTAVDILITDDGLPAAAREALRDAVGELVIVTVGSEATLAG